MTYDITYESQIKLHIPYKKIIKEVIELCIDYEKCPYEVEVSITVVDDDKIQELNEEFRNIDKSTDVLSFPLNEFKKPALFDDDFEDSACFNPETGELMLGDIVLSSEHIISQANEYGHTKSRELAFLVTHSMLHLMGYDHIKEDERIVMEDRQKKILEKGKYHR